MNLRESYIGISFIVAIVAGGSWVASRPEALRNIQLLQEPVDPSSLTPIAPVCVRKVSWSTDSRRLLALAQGEIGYEGPLVLHDLDAGPHRLTIGASNESIVLAELVPDGQHVLVATREGRLWWSGLQSGENKLLLDLPATTEFSWLAISRSGTQAAVASTDGSIYLINPQSDAEQNASKRLINGPATRTTRMGFSKDGTSLAAAAYDGSVSVWDLESGQMRQSWKGHNQSATAVAMLPDERIVSASLDDSIRIWDVANEHEIWHTQSGLLGVTALSISDDGRSAAWGGHRRKVVVWDLENEQLKFEIQISASMVWDIQFSPDSKLLAVAGNDGTLQLYDAKTGAEKELLEVG
jgi:cytochrome c